MALLEDAVEERRRKDRLRKQLKRDALKLRPEEHQKALEERRKKRKDREGEESPQGTKERCRKNAHREKERRRPLLLRNNQMRRDDLPDDVKKAYHTPGGGGARGYTPFGTEKAKDAKVHDLKEFWHVGRQLPEGHDLAEYMPANIWPAEIDGFRETFLELYAAFEEAGGRVLEGIALHLGLPRQFFVPTVEDGNSVMRLLRYPPLEGAEAEGAIRAAAHGDINTITLLLGAEEAGLELLTSQGEWKAGQEASGEVTVAA